MLEANKCFYSKICGKLLGDGCFTRQKGRKPRFQFIHKAEDFEWANYCFNELKDFIPLNSPKYKQVNDTRIKRGFTECYYVQSRTNEIITQLDRIWYPERVKQIPFPFKDSYLNEETLAWWYQDDGHLKEENGIPRKIILSTDNFTPDENLQLINILRGKFHLHFSIDGQNRLILYDQPQIIYFNRLICPYLHSSMDRKIIKFNERATKKFPRITTVHLPDNLLINKPTSEINQQLDKLPYLYEMIDYRESYLEFYNKKIRFLRNQQSKKTYQVKFNNKQWYYLDNIKQKTGLNYSQIVLICFKFDLI
ncbi:endonuclease [Neobacillus sp. 114]|uniref:endonuclease n=1 Tax=Neobacillus sp. 114 TaxID=3048535 RepID=UPI0024C43B65|nr:endonuclease [Neobacillus sp. 114]